MRLTGIVDGSDVWLAVESFDSVGRGRWRDRENINGGKQYARIGIRRSPTRFNSPAHRVLTRPFHNEKPELVMCAARLGQTNRSGVSISSISKRLAICKHVEVCHRRANARMQLVSGAEGGSVAGRCGGRKKAVIVLCGVVDRTRGIN
jgi:hypothetical protein